ncbi:MAG: phosphatase PAP2 family protein, partial [Lachnospiraceae bacterium]|nr:phosphatase PAP2 family protein [Lachnospiraceae bacterium]
MSFTLPFDLPMLEGIQSSMRNDFFDGFFKTVTHLGDAGIFWILLTIALLIIPKTRKLGYCSAIALVLDVLLVNCCIKPIVNRDRPYTMAEYAARGIQLLIKKAHDASFPSGHTAASFASAVAILFYNRKIGIPAIILAAIIGFSRLYVAIHFPSDVFVGAIVGILCAIIAY